MTLEVIVLPVTRLGGSEGKDTVHPRNELGGNGMHGTTVHKHSVL